MKSLKIQRLKFISDKIEGGDCKREVMCICFGYLMKKNELVWASPWEGNHDRAQGPLMVACQARRRGREWKGRGARERRVRLGGSMGRGRAAGAAWGGLAGWWWLFLHALFMLNVRRKQQAGRRREGGKREENEKKRKGRKRKERKRKEKNGKFFKLENF
jgi:hypothetical protein